MFASAKRLGNLIAFTDCNGLQLDGPVCEINDLAPLPNKWSAFGWHVIEVGNGNDPDQLKQAIDKAKSLRETGHPTMVILHTVKGCGVSAVINKGAGNHNMPFSEEDAKRAVAEIRGAK